MRKILYLALPVLFLAACTKDISRFNNDTKKPTIVPGSMLFSNATRNMADGLIGTSVNINVFRFTVNHWAMATYQDEAQYNFTTRAIPQSWWTRFYRDVLKDLAEGAKLISADAYLDPGIKQNQLAIIDITQVYAYSVLINSFGDIPYKAALDGENVTPVYDDAKTVYADLLKRLADDLGKLKNTSTAFASADDILYGGSVDAWIRFGNTLQFKMGMMLADVDNATAKALVEAADAKAFSSFSQSAIFKYQKNSPNQSPIYTDIVSGGRSDYVAAKDLMDPLISLNDPRKTLFFTANDAGKYAGGIVGASNTYEDFSHPGPRVYAADSPYVFLDYVELEFLRAEALERGYAVAGTAEQHYNNAIANSIVYWGGTAAQANTYLGQADVAYTTAPAAGGWKQKIGFQKWIALFNRPFEGWTEVRRLDYPKLTPVVNAVSKFPTRFPYPGNEQQLNGTNYTTAAGHMGGDKVDFKLFWDKN
ncbi:MULTISPECIES: SusD/RagB family nutrient-binding outer membrane lipoprotein [Niastella]|uniref:SusD/RagB family nutrient-binding outer membrane lipoprotein n=1 Tax=Niastella soli TaxID=2821487 RepID=A0ABS3YSQ6_9BACT|nr:SusD/RagB family nutrient-binding outer membrane lipoprotein [Niastella soli]MBO9200946.1 SusD/RagB family nutrient-binding outer membrane lipoprotein [Niastella soli]